MTDAPDGLAAWLLEQVDVDEVDAREAIERTTTSKRWINGEWKVFQNPPSRWHASAWTPDRVLAECRARRLIIDDHSTLHTRDSEYCTDCGGQCTHAGEDKCEWHGWSRCQTLQTYAAVYVAIGRQGCRDAWREQS